MTNGRARALLGSVMAVALVAACGSSGSSPGASSATAGTGPTASSGGAPSVAATGTQAAATPAGSSGSGAGAQVQQAAQALIPPHSTEVVKTTTETYWYVTYHSTDSVDALKSFYEGAISRAGLKTVSTTTASGTVNWVVSRDDAGSFGGAITVAPSQSGSGSDIVVAIGTN